MSLYDWPPGGGESGEGDDPGGRGAFMRRHRVELDAEGARRIARSGPQPTPGVPRAPASGRTHLWQSLGPDTVVDGQVIGSTRIAGRVNMLAVHPAGERVYAASANGGVWHSADGGLHWRTLGGLAATPSPASINRPAQRNACGSIAVDWNAAGGELVYVGTGETTHGRDAQPGHSLGGIGILRAQAPAAAASDDPWTREGDTLLGHGVCRIALQPGGSGVVAATTTGLFERQGTGSWQRLGADPFGSLDAKCSDVLWTAGDGARPERLWVWVEDGGNTGLWVRDGNAGPFQRLLQPKAPASAALTETVIGRATFAISDPAAAPDQIYLFNDHGKKDGSGVPRLLRIACASAAAPTVRVVTNVPDVLGRQGFYDIALAVHPTQADRVVVGGATFPAITPTGQRLRASGNTDDGGIVMADVAANGAGTLVFGLPATPSRMIGAGVHADVHDLAFSNGGSRLWTACDGGVYRSDRIDNQVGFAAVNEGLSVVESNYITCHPVCEGLVVAGLQDNGIISRRSGAVWLHEGDGDGGGVAFDPTQPARYVRQYFRGNWGSFPGALALPLTAAERDNRCAFYSTPAAVTKQRPGAPPAQRMVTQLVIGTSRVWYTEDFGTSWVTLPGGTPPPPGNLDHDGFGQKITVCRWQGPEVAWILGEGQLRRYARTGGSDTASGPGTWSAETVIVRGVKNKKDETKANGPIRDAAVWTDVAVNLEPPPAADQPPAVRGSRGAVYLGTIGKAGDDEVDTLWWFNGIDRWFATRLRRDGVPAPVTAIVCDPAFPDEVYVGTTIGVWKGVRNLADPAAPTWTWSSRVNGLPEATVEDLALYNLDGLRLLRAALASRGVWELRLDTADVADLAYLRAHDDDLRHRATASTLGRDGTTQRSWHASPDVCPRRASVAATTPATLPWTQGSPLLDAEQLRRFQSALRARTGDIRVRPTGQWDDWFSEVLRSLGAPTVAPGTVRLDQAFWEQSMQMPWAIAAPWGATRPASADLLEFGAALPDRARTIASCDLPPGPSQVDVQVQHRGLPLDGSGVRVALLKWLDPQLPPTARHDDSTTWPGGNVPWTGAANQVLNSAGGTTALALGSGWSLVGSRQTLAGQTLDPSHPGVATFDLELTGVAADRLVLLVAVVRAGADIALAPAPLENLVLGHPGVAVRSMRITGTSVATPAVRNPFPTVPYALQMAASAAQNTRLAAAIATVRGTLGAANQGRLDQAALIVVKLTPAGAMDYAGVRETQMFFSASLLKVVLLYASFELVAQVNALAPALTASSVPGFLDRVRREFSAAIERSVRRIPAGSWRAVSFGQVLTATPTGADQFRVALSSTHETHVARIFSEQDQNISPRDTMHRLGYSYVNRALEAAGFLDAASGTGIWMATDYGGWSDFHVPVSTRSSGGNPRNGSSSAAMAALPMANLLAHMHRDQLVDAVSSQRMRAMFEAGRVWSWFGQVANPEAFSFEVTGCKIGHASSGSAFVGSVFSEAATLRRKSDSARFLAVWQNVPDALGFEPVYRVIDAMVRTWP
ncbi:MAG: hypothetical protein JWP65_3271 [Ramlibacter sp.]|uniref:hypothetical protein n=1 Tax=Ramlibacter sp. TaxID=1917967 RepID=UPI002612B798|nr:hypothetical protein [Ramlibacter sp.]MDB5752850.1 hypothetical protein [Ramlibacter sp.]